MNRRTLLSTAAALPVAAVPALAAVHPDAAIFALWDDYRSACFAMQAASEGRPAGTAPPAWEAAAAASDAAEAAIAARPVATPAGAAVKLRWLLGAYGETGLYWDAAFGVTAPAGFGDDRHDALWRLIADLEAMEQPR